MAANVPSSKRFQRVHAKNVRIEKGKQNMRKKRKKWNEANLVGRVNAQRLEKKKSQWWRVACARFNTIPTAAVPLNASYEHHRRPESLNIYFIFGFVAAFRTSPVAPPTKWQTAHSPAPSAILRLHLSVSRAEVKQTS